jgi:hypothetical protein
VGIRYEGGHALRTEKKTEEAARSVVQNKEFNGLFQSTLNADFRIPKKPMTVTIGGQVMQFDPNNYEEWVTDEEDDGTTE